MFPIESFPESKANWLNIATSLVGLFGVDCIPETVMRLQECADPENAGLWQSLVEHQIGVVSESVWLAVPASSGRLLDFTTPECPSWRYAVHGVVYMLESGHALEQWNQMVVQYSSSNQTV